MKSFTDIEQSKKLAEILPLESADMYYTPPLIKGHTDHILHLKRKLPIDWDIEQAIPCWSLSTLLDILPKYIGDYGKCLYYDMGYYYCGYMVDGDFMLTIEETKADNPIDACYEMILKLKEKRLL